MRKYVLFCLFVLFTTQLIFAQNKNYNITVKVEGIKNDYAVLAYYYGDKKYVKDTLRFDAKSVATIKGEKDVKSGVYMAVFPSLNNKYFEFIINETEFGIETDTTDFITKMKVKNSIENQIFYSDQNFIFKLNKEIDELSGVYKSLDSTSTEIDTIRKQIIAKNKQIQDSRKAIIEKHGSTLYGKILKILEEIEIPKDMDSSKVLSYYRTTYLNSIDFSDAALIRSPVIEGKIKKFLDKHTSPSVDSITRACDWIIEKAKADKDFYQYVVNLLINKYAASNIMGHEGVYVHMAEKYYLSGKAEWADQATIDKLKKRVIAIKPTLIGKVAPEIAMTDLYGNPVSLSKFVSKHDFTIIAWWNSTCGHCKKEMPKLQAMYDSILVDLKVGVFAVSTEHQDDQWKKVIEELKLNGFTHAIDLTDTNPAQAWYDVYSTPLILVLNNKGKILAKKISIEDIPGLIEFERRIAKN